MPPWTFIAGDQEPGERAEDTAIREVKEETGFEIRAGEVIGERVHPKTSRRMIYMAAELVCEAMSSGLRRGRSARLEGWGLGGPRGKDAQPVV